MGYQTHPGGSRLGGADPKIIAASLFCGVALLWGTYTIVGAMSSDGDQPERAQPLKGAFDDEGNELETDYARTGSSSAVERVANEIGVAINEQAAPVLEALGVGVGTPHAVASAARDAFVPLLKGDHDAFVDAVRAMGGSISESLDGEHPLFTHLEGVFKGAEVDVSRVTVSQYEREDRRVRSRRVVVDQESDSAGRAPGRGVNRSVREIQPASVFPDAPGSDDASAIEVSIPVRPKGEDNESVFGLVLTWNADAGLWQPAAYRVTTVTVTEGGEP
jgi:hypothetical protein